MPKTRAQVVHRFSDLSPWGSTSKLNGPFHRSNLQISKSVLILKKLFSEGRIDSNKIQRSNDGDEVRIPVIFGFNGSARNFMISLKPINENFCHIEIKENFPQAASKIILKDAGITHHEQQNRIDKEDNEFVSHLRREIIYLTKSHPLASDLKVVDRITAEQLAKPNDFIKAAGLTIEGSNERVASFLSKPNIDVHRESSSKESLEKLIKLTDPTAPPKESTLKFKLTNPDGKDQAKLTVSDRNGIVLLKERTIRIERSTRHQDRSPAVKALFKAVGKLNNEFNASTAA